MANMSKNFWVGVFASVLLGTPAVAADMAVKAMPMAPPVVYTWTGCYIGASGGGVWAHKVWNDRDQFSRFNGLNRADHTADGGMVGGQIGCDYQFGRFVIGIEGSYHWVDASVTNPDLQGPAFFRNTTDVTGLGTITGRAGYAVMDQALIYVRGGVAFERDRYTITSVTANLPFATGGEDRTGGLIGVGFEYMFTKNLSVFAEYDYIDMGSRNIDLRFVNGNGFTTYNIRERKDVVKVGLNWRFNWAQPVVAKD
jgi:outer membrane immunogenic protein